MLGHAAICEAFLDFRAYFGTKYKFLKCTVQEKLNSSQAESKKLLFRNVLIVYSPFFRTHSLPPPKLFYVLPLLRFAFFHHVFFPDFDIVLLHLHEFFCIYAVRAPARNLFVFLFYPTFSLFFRWLTHLAIEFREDDIKERRLSISVIQIPYWRFDIIKTRHTRWFIMKCRRKMTDLLSSPNFSNYSLGYKSCYPNSNTCCYLSL